MDKLNFVWERKTIPFSNGYYLKLGGIVIGSVDWNSNRSKRETGNQYVGSTQLPALTSYIYGESETDLMKRVETRVTTWFKQVLCA